MDTALLEWFKQARNCNIPITGKILMEKAQVFATAMNVSTFIALQVSSIGGREDIL